MPHRKTELAPGEFYHVYNRGANRQRIFFDRDNYLFFLRRLREKLPREHVSVVAYCLMLNHYHLLVRLESDGFSDHMQAFGTSYTKAINKRHGHSGTLFQGRFRAKHVDQEDYLVHLTRYILSIRWLPGWSLAPSDWEFSSYREYIGTRNGTLPRPEIILTEFANREHYRRFVEDGSVGHPASIGHLLFDE